MRLFLPKLAAVAPVLERPFENRLLDPGVTWPADVNYLRDTYTDIHSLYETLKDPSQDKMLFTEASPKVAELLTGLTDVVKQLPRRLMNLFAEKVLMARDTAGMSELHARSGNFYEAVTYQTYALLKLHNILSDLTLLARRRTLERKSSLFKRGFDYVADGSGIEQEVGLEGSRQKELKDTANPEGQNKTPHNPANINTDSAAQEFPWLEGRGAQMLYHGMRE